MSEDEMTPAPPPETSPPPPAQAAPAPVAAPDTPTVESVAPPPPRQDQPRQDHPRQGQPRQGQERQGRERHDRHPRDRRRGDGGSPPGGGGGRDRQAQRQQHQPWAKQDFLARAVKSGIDREFIDSAREFARAVGPGFSSGQVRGIYGEILRQEAGGLDPARLLLLKPRLAYLASGQGRNELRDLRAVLERAIDAIAGEDAAEEERRARFERFALGFEAILSYHKGFERKQGDRP